MMRRSLIIKGLIFTVLGCCVLFLAAISYFYYTINDQVESKLEVTENSFAYSKEGVVFEEGAQTSKKKLSKFFLFTTESLGFTHWLKEHQVEASKSRFIFTQEAKLSGLMTNECELDRCYQLRRQFSQIPNNIKQALIGVEDLRFLSHGGVDLRSILRAIIVDLKNMRLVQGGSTITQQVVKNLILTQEKTLVRKLKEIFIALYIERFLSKEEILTLYFNETYWGSIGGVKIKGVAAASMLYFEKPLSEMTEYESAILISLLKGPYYYHPIYKTERLRNRADFLFNKLRDEKQISQYTKGWDDKKWQAWVERLKIAQDAYDYLVLSRLSVEAGKRVNINDFEKYIVQTKVADILKGLNKKSFAAKVYLKDVTCKEDCSDPYFFYSSFERDQQEALIKEKHSIGSVVKPIIYSHLFQNGVLEEQLFSTEKLRLKLKTSVWRPRESTRNIPDQVPPSVALRRSLNRPLLRMVDLVGYESVETFLKDYFPELKTPLKEYPSQILGAIEIPVQNLADAYERFIKYECENIRKNDQAQFDNESDEEFIRTQSAMEILSDHQSLSLIHISEPTRPY